MLGIPRIIAFSLPALPLAGLSLPLVVFLPPFFVQEYGLSLSLVGTLFLTARIWDVVSDPLVGAFSDLVPWPGRRRRIALAASVPLLILATVLVYMPPGAVTLFYLLFWLLVLYLAWTLATISHVAWAAELSTDYHCRSWVQGWLLAFQTVGMLAVVAVPVVVEIAMPLSPRGRIASMGIYISVLLPLTVAAAVMVAPETRAEAGRPLAWREAWPTLKRNLPLRQILVIDFLVALATGTTGSLFVLFATHVMKLEAQANLVLLCYLGTSVLAIPLWLALSRRWQKHRALSVASLGLCAVTPAFLFLAPGDSTSFLIASAAIGATFGAAPFLLKSMMADVTDLDAVEGGGRRSGLLFALLAMTGKVGYALAIGIGFLLLDALGFDRRRANADDPASALRYLFVLVPMFVHAVAAVVAWRYAFGEERQGAALTELAGSLSAGESLL